MKPTKAPRRPKRPTLKVDALIIAARAAHLWIAPGRFPVMQAREAARVRDQLRQALTDLGEGAGL